MAIKNQELTVHYYAFDTDNNIGKTGDVANHTLYVTKDAGSPIAVTNIPSEMARGNYQITLTAEEMNCNSITLEGESSSSGVLIIPSTIITERGDVKDIQASVDSIGSGTGAALNFAAGADNTGGAIKGVTFVGTQTNTFASTAAEDGTKHSITDVGNSIDIVYQFNIGAGRNAAKVVFKGYVQGVGDIVTVKAYNGSTWDTRATINGQSGTANITKDISLLATHTGVGADSGLVFIRFISSSDTVLHIDELLTSGVAVGMTTGYSDGAVWVHSSGTSGTTSHINGTADNPCAWADALVVVANVGLDSFHILNEDTITLSAPLIEKTMTGHHWYFALGGQEIADCYFKGGRVTGIGAGSDHNYWDDMEFGNGTLGATITRGIFRRCGISCPNGAPFIGSAVGQYVFVDCFSQVAGSNTPYFDFPGASGINFRRWSGGSNIVLNDPTAKLSLDVVSGGGQTIACAGASVEIRGNCRAITVNGIASTSTINICAVTGPIILEGADGTVNIYGITGSVTDNRTGTPILNRLAVSQERFVGGAVYINSYSGITGTEYPKGEASYPVDNFTDALAILIANKLSKLMIVDYAFVSVDLSNLDVIPKFEGTDRTNSMLEIGQSANAILAENLVVYGYGAGVWALTNCEVTFFSDTLAGTLIGCSLSSDNNTGYLTLNNCYGINNNFTKCILQEPATLRATNFGGVMAIEGTSENNQVDMTLNGAEITIVSGTIEPLTAWSFSGVGKVINEGGIVNLIDTTLNMEVYNLDGNVGNVEDKVDTVIAELASETYGLDEIKDAVDNIDFTAIINALDEIKGEGWTDQTLKLINTNANDANYNSGLTQQFISGGGIEEAIRIMMLPKIVVKEIEIGKPFSIHIDYEGIFSSIISASGHYMVVGSTEIPLIKDVDFEVVSSLVGSQYINEFKLLNTALLTDGMEETDIQVMLIHSI